MFKKGLFLFLTAFLLICSVSLASASGLFSELNETDYADERLPVLDEVADVVSVSQTIDSVTVEVSQAYLPRFIHTVHLKKGRERYRIICIPFGDSRTRLYSEKYFGL